MNRPKQRDPLRHPDRSGRSLHKRRKKQPATSFIAAITVTLAVLPLSACSDGGGSIIRSWLMKQDGVEKVDVTHSNCTFLDSYCNTDATISLSSNTTPDAACSLIQKADEELPKKKRIDSYETSLTFTWQYRGTELTLEDHETPIANTTNTDKDPSQECEILNIAAEHTGEGMDKISIRSWILGFYRGNVNKVPDNLFTRTPSPDKKLRTESWDHFTLDDWYTTVTASSATAASEPATKKLLTQISQTPGPDDRSQLSIFFQLGGYQGDSPESEITVGGLGGNSFAGPDTDAAAPVLAIAMKQPEISKISLCPSSKKGSSKENCIVYSKKNGSFDTDSEHFTGRTREIYEAAKKLP